MLSLLFAFIPLIGLLSILGGIAAVVLGFIGRSRVKKGQARGGGMALTGIITGFISIVLAIVMTIAVGSWFANVLGDPISNYNECLNQGNTQAFCQEQMDRELEQQFMP